MKKWTGDWAEIFRFSAKDIHLQEGRVPLLVTKSGSFDELVLSHSYNSSELLIFNDMGTFKSKKWYRFRISLKKYVSKNYINRISNNLTMQYQSINFQSEYYAFQVVINNIEKVWKKLYGDQPEGFSNVKVFAGGNFHDAANAEIRNFRACLLSNPELAPPVNYLCSSDTEPAV